MAKSKPNYRLLNDVPVEDIIDSQKLGQWQVGDLVELNDFDDAIDEIVKAKKLQIVAFTIEDNVVTQIDGKRCVIDDLAEFTDWYKKIKSGKKKSVQISAQKGRRRAKKAFINLLTNTVQEKISDLQKQIEANDENIAKQSEKLEKATRSLNQARKDQRQAMSHSKAAELLGQEFEALCRLPKIKKIALQDKKLSIFTEPLRSVPVQSGRRIYDLGEYRIDIDLNNSSIRFFFLKNEKSKQRHPHIKSDGNICWGNIGSGVDKLLKQREFSALIPVLIQFLETVD